MKVEFSIPKIEMDRFQAQLRAYQEATKKDSAYVVNRTALNVAIKASQSTPLANREAIRGLENRPWWPKFIAKKLKKKQGKYTRAEAQKESKRIIRYRISRRGWVRVGWRPAIAILAAAKAGGRPVRIPGKPKFIAGAGPGTAIVAKPGIVPLAEIVNMAGKAAQPVAGPALRIAIRLATLDMRNYIRSKFGETARKFSK